MISYPESRSSSATEIAASARRGAARSAPDDAALDEGGEGPTLQPSGHFVRNVPIAFARARGVLGLADDRSDAAPRRAMRVATADLEDHHARDILRRRLGVAIEPVAVDGPRLSAAINHAYGRRSGVAREFIDRLDRDSVMDQVAELEGREDLLNVSDRAPVIKLVNLVLFEAVQQQASDIHVQPYLDKLIVRMRIDGVLFDIFNLPAGVRDELVSRVKVMGRMNIAEKRLPQDGRATVQVGDRMIDLRISTVPSSCGERVVIRLLDKSARLYTLGELGMDRTSLDRFRRLIGVEHGLILVTGPTGSGKTTTLYAALGQINSTQRNIITLEDPIEYQLDGISQIQISEKKGMTFAKGLRSVLRQDPDIIMVGEIRDHETAVMAIQSALTGHLVFSTLHTNDAASAVTRLLDLGIEPYLVGSSLVGVLAQRLVRRVCDHCARPTEPDPEQVRSLEGDVDPRAFENYRQGVGCEQCRSTGYHGRAGCFELLTVDDEIRSLVQARATAAMINETAGRTGMRSLGEDGLAKAAAGTTTLEEVLRVSTRGAF